MAASLCLWLAALPAAFAISPDKPLAQHIYEHWTTDHGLPQNSVIAIEQTPDGFLWLGTYEGLVRFDGTRIEPVNSMMAGDMGEAIAALWVAPDGALWVATHDRGLSRLHRHESPRHWGAAEGLPSNTVHAVRGRSAHDVWIGTSAGAMRLADGQLVAVAGVPDIPVRDIAFTPDGRTWLATRSSDVFVVDSSGQATRMPLGLEDAPATSIAVAPDGTLWVGTTRGLVHVGPEGVIRRYGVADGLASWLVTRVLFDAGGTLWIGLEGAGVQRLRDDGRFESFAPAQGLHNPFVQSLFVDARLNLWIGTSLGVGRLRDGLVTGYGRPQGMRGEFARVVAEDADGAIWVGTDGGGLVRIDRRGVRNFGRADGLLGETVRSLAGDRDGALWIGVHGAGLQRMKDDRLQSWTAADGLPSPLIRAIVPTDDGLWLATEGAGLVRMREGRFEAIDRAAGMPSNDVRVLLRDPDGTLLAGTYDGGIAVVRDGKVADVLDESDGLPSSRVFALHRDRHGHLWIGTQVGLARHDGRRILHLRDAGPSFRRAVFFIGEDRGGALWFTGNRGITHLPAEVLGSIDDYAPSTLPHGVVTRHDGLLSQQINGGSQPAGLVASDGRLWFPTARGVATIDPARLAAPETPPRVQIESLFAQGRPVPLSAGNDTLLLEPGNNRVEIHYAGVHDLIPGSPLYQTRLDGLETRWSAAGDRRNALYAALPPGDYTFRVRAVSPRGTRGEREAALSFRIEPRLYQKAWFQGLAGLGLVLAGAGLFALRTARLQRLNRALECKVAERTAELDEKNRQVQAAYVEMERISHTDPLTGLHNRRFLQEIIEPELAQALRRHTRQIDLPAAERERLAVLMIDIDHFKAINDRHGHAVGDRVLCAVAAALRRTVRTSEHVVRWGGEEFLVLARDLRAGEAGVLAQRIVEAIARVEVDTEGETLRCTGSVGLAHYPFFPSSPLALGWEGVLAVADLALYQAKSRGRRGWVALSPAPGASDPDLVRRLLRDPALVLAEGGIVLETGTLDAAPIPASAG